MNFRSIDQLSVALFQWSDRLPGDLRLVVGIPRSGMLAATIFALHRNLPCQGLDSFLAGLPPKGGLRMEDVAQTVAARQGRVLVLDDSVTTGTQMAKVRELLKQQGLLDRVILGAVYATREGAAHVDVHAEIVEWPRVFDWNIFHHGLCGDFLFDLDGVLCRDPSGEENDDGPRYIEFMETVPARAQPTYKVKGIVTARLEKYRPQTERWLASNGIRYEKLYMLDLPSGEERRRLGAHAPFKASVYGKSDAALFIESSVEQAIEIVRQSNRYVYCSDVRQMIVPGETGRRMWQLRYSPFSRWKGLKRRIRRVLSMVR